MRKLLLAFTAVAVMSGTAPSAHAVSYTASAVPFGFIDISGTGTVIPGLAGDDASASVALPFTFDFFGVNHNTVFVSTNGLLTFGTGNSSFTNADLTSNPTQASIAAFWDDLNGGTVRSQTIGAAGSQQFILQWNTRFFSTGATTDLVAFQAILSEGSNDIRFNYQDLVSGAAAGNNGASATVGIKAAGAQGTDRLLLAFNNGPNAFVGTEQSTLIQQQNVPEPTSLMLIGTGVLGLLARARRRR